MSYMHVYGYEYGPDCFGENCYYEEEPIDEETSSSDDSNTQTNDSSEDNDIIAEDTESSNDEDSQQNDEQTEETPSVTEENNDDKENIIDNDSSAEDTEVEPTDTSEAISESESTDEVEPDEENTVDDEASETESSEDSEIINDENEDSPNVSDEVEDSEIIDDENADSRGVSDKVEEKTEETPADTDEESQQDAEPQHAEAAQPLPWWAPGATMGVPTLPAYADLWVKACPNHEVIIDINNKNNQALTLYPSLNSELSESETGDLIYRAHKNFQGVDTFTYKLKDKSYIVKVTVKDDDSCQTQQQPIQVPPAACQVYAVHDEKRSDSQFLTIDPNGYTTVALGSMHKQHDIEGIAIEPKSHTLYAISGGSSPDDGTLYLVNPLTSELTVVGNTDFSEVTDLAFHPDSSLWAWSEDNGLIQIDPKTAESQLYFASELNVEGLAWDAEGQMLYASEGQNLWAFDDQEQSLNLVCQNFPGEVESLDTLADGMLLFSVNDDASNTVFVYEPKSCSILLDRRFATKTGYTDIEAISWPLDCQVSEDVPAWQAHFHGETDNELVCLEEPRWLTVSGYMSLDPADKHLYLETFWQLTAEEEKVCAEIDEFDEPPTGRCTQMQYPKQLVTDASEFNIKVWWPGLPKRARDDTQITVEYGLNVLDLNGDPLPLSRLTKQLVGSHSLCAADEAPACQDETECQFIETEEQVACDPETTECAEEIVEDEEAIEEVVEESTCEADEADCKEAVVCEDEACLEAQEHALCDDDDKCQPPVEDLERELKQPIDIAAIQRYLADEQFVLDDKGQLLVWFEEQWHIFIFAEQWADDRATADALELTLIDDENADGYRDYVITYPDGQVQLLYYLGVAESIVEEDEALETPISDDIIDDELSDEESASEVEETEEEHADEESASEAEETEEEHADEESASEAEETEEAIDDEENTSEAEETEDETIDSKTEDEEVQESSKQEVKETESDSKSTDTEVTVVQSPDDDSEQKGAKQPSDEPKPPKANDSNKATQEKDDKPKKVNETQAESTVKNESQTEAKPPVDTTPKAEPPAESAPVVILPEPTSMVSPPAEAVSTPTAETSVVETAAQGQ
ncbi:MAG: hypothetical protein SVR94_03820 [Pseudomonadota bacterium]|nr:hypothetical protein [Pseudomonadota bacterium]